MHHVTTEPVAAHDSIRIHRWAGASGIAFVVIVVLQNVLRAGAPGNDASPAEIVRHFHDHRSLEWFLVVTFVASGVALARYCGGLWHVVTAAKPEARDWLVMGVLGVTGVIATFSGMVACEVGMMVAARMPAVSASVVPTLWILHNALFAILNLMLGIALLGLASAATRARVAPRAFAVVGPVGAALHVIAACFAPALVESTSSAAMVPAAAGFLCWLAFLAVSGWNLMHLETGAIR